ncbi:MAG: GNAT family N-acetyltransferase [Nitrospinae bacterium]|nr:GNAT family N-acetyltransferase [Nitrospinota bacterium]
MSLEFKRAVKPATLQRIKDWLKECNGSDPVISGGYFVAVKEGRIEGCVCLLRRSWFLTEIRHLYVLPERRGHGVGTFLVREGLGKVKTPMAAVTVREDNAASIRIDERLGFERWNRFTNPATGHPVLLLGKVIG